MQDGIYETRNEEARWYLRNKKRSINIRGCLFCLHDEDMIYFETRTDINLLI